MYMIEYIKYLYLFSKILIYISFLKWTFWNFLSSNPAGSFDVFVIKFVIKYILKSYYLRIIEIISWKIFVINF